MKVRDISEPPIHAPALAFSLALEGQRGRLFPRDPETGLRGRICRHPIDRISMFEETRDDADNAIARRSMFAACRRIESRLGVAVAILTLRDSFKLIAIYRGNLAA